MRNLLFLLYLSVFQLAFARWFDSLNNLKPKVTEEVQEQAVYNLLKRVLSDYPNQADQFVVTVDSSLNNENETVIIDKGTTKNTITINGTSGVAVAYGIYAYLKTCCNVHFSWDGNQIALPTVLPQPTKPSTLTSVGMLRYYANVCTFSYSFVWWDWAQWEQHLDWMALNGINFPLAHVGQEIIWKKVFMSFGLSEADVNSFLTGPAFLAWHRMGNLKLWAGPLSDSYLEGQLQLQKLILQRMLELGMIPILPAFAGHVPDAMTKLYPKSQYTQLSKWAGFNCTYSCLYFVEPTDPLFQQIGSSFMNEMNRTFGGLYQAYSADPFNEMTPETFEPNYIHEVFQSIYKGMAVVDPNAIWVMQAWMFVGTHEWFSPNVVDAMTSAVPEGHLLFLDLYSEEYPIFPLVDSYHNQPFIWCMLHNFGGKQGLFGSVEKVNQGLQMAVHWPNTTLVGTGLTMEGINQNYPIYDMALDLYWSPEAKPLNQTAWIRSMTTRRYGKDNPEVADAWELLWKTIYNCTDIPYSYKCNDYSNSNPIITSLPDLSMLNELWYNPHDVCSAWKIMIDQSAQFQTSDLYRRDLVDITRQVLQNIAAVHYASMIVAFDGRGLNRFKESGRKFMQIFLDLDTLLTSDDHFLLGAWLSDAHRLANGSEDDQAQFEFNARNQITLWGPSGQILDYARKQWGGLMLDYYGARWEVFFEAMLENLFNRTRFDVEKIQDDILINVEQPFGLSNKTYTSKALNDSIQIVKQIFARHGQECGFVVFSKADVLKFSFPLSTFVCFLFVKRFMDLFD